MLKKLFFALATTFAFQTSTAQVLGVPGEEKMAIGIYIYDIGADTAFAYNHNQGRVPASVMKSFTTASAMSLLGKDYRFSTRAELRGGRNGNVWDGSLRIIGGGDPTLESANFKGYNGFCDSIVNHLQHLGIKRINGTIEVIDHMKDAGPVETWEISDVPWAYGAGVYGLSWRDNICTVWPATGKTEPFVPDLEVVCSKGRTSSLSRGMGSETLTVSAPRASSASASRTTTVPFPFKVMVNELCEKLNAAGIEVGYEDTPASVALTPLYTHVSPPLYDILGSLLKRSDNMYAESVLRAFAPDAPIDSCIAIEKSLWTQRGLDFSGVNIVDGSGLTRANFLSPVFVASMLKWMAGSPMIDDYIAMFPVSGESGTMRNFMKDTPLQGKLAFKTGSLNGVQSYAGYALDDDKKPSHIVVIFVNHMTCSRDTLKKGIANLLLKKIPHNDITTEE